MSGFSSVSVDFDEVPAILKSHPIMSPNSQSDIDYQQCFQSTTNDPDTVALVRGLTDTRIEAVAMLKASQSNGPPTRTIQSIDAYIPHLFRLMVSLNNQGPVPLDVSLSFTWQSAIDHSPYSFPELVFELVMVMYAKAAMHQQEACRLLEVDRVNNLSVAGQQYLAAAGVFEYLGTVLLPKWFPTPGVVTRRPVECSPTWCVGMAWLCEASAQSCAVVKALTKGGPEVLPSYAILTKLCVSVVDKCRSTLDTIEPAILSFVGTSLTSYVGYVRDIHHALAFYYHGESQYAADECGLAMSYYRGAKRLLQEQAPGVSPDAYAYSHSAPGLPKLAREFADVAPVVRALCAKIDCRNLKADNDNKLIYFQDTPSDVDRPPLPAGVSIMARKALNVSAFESAAIVLFFKIT